MKTFRYLLLPTTALLTLTLSPITAFAAREDRRDRRQDKREDVRDNRDDRQDNRQDRREDRRDDEDRRVYFARPRNTYTVTFGVGYRGRGYYYGPAGVAYYYEGPGVVYYPTRAVVPSSYVVVDAPAVSVATKVQVKLARQNYYNGPIDGDIGPGSRKGIARYQADHGLVVTGTINNALLKSLDLL